MVDDLDDDEPHPAHDASTNEDKNLETNDSEQEKQKQHVVCPMLGSDVDMICQSTLFLDNTWVYFAKLSIFPTAYYFSPLSCSPDPG